MEGRQVAKRVPVKRAAIGASHEVYPSAEAACRATVARCVADRIALEAEARRTARGARRRVIVTTPILRSIDGGLDDLKFLYPVLDNIPLIIFPILSYALAGVEVSVYGSREVGSVVEVVRSRLLADGLIEDRNRILFVEEDRGEISLMQSFRRSTAPFAASPEEVIVWSAGDLVLAYNTYPKLMDRHASTHEIVLDLNARQVVFPDGTAELFPRNYFDSLRLDGEGGRVVDVKEPNVILFTAAGMGGLAELDKLRTPRRGQTYLGALVQAVLKASRGASPAATLAFLRYSFQRTRGALRPSDALAQRHAVALASAVFGVPTMVKAENADPFLVKDCDSFEDLFGYYRAFLQSIVDSGVTRSDGFHELAQYYPYADGAPSPLSRSPGLAGGDPALAALAGGHKGQDRDAERDAPDRTRGRRAREFGWPCTGILRRARHLPRCAHAHRRFPCNQGFCFGGATARPSLRIARATELAGGATAPFALDRMLPFWVLVFNLREVAQDLKHMEALLPQIAVKTA